MEAASNRRAQRNGRRPIACDRAQNPAYKPTHDQFFHLFDLIFSP